MFLPLSPDRLFEDLNPDGIVLVGVSGGGDSVALLLLAHGWAMNRGITLHAVTVDHGLRPEAAAEAAFVAGLCEGLGIDHTTLAWDGIKPHSGLANAARRARYALMEEFAQEIGADLILTGHTADDQAETVCMRLRRHAATTGSGTGRGLAGIPSYSLLPGGCRLARPLLGVRRAQLRDYLAIYPQNWIEDPTNFDRSYERVRIRQQIAGDPTLGDRLVAFGRAMAGMRAVLARDTATLLTASVSQQAGGVLSFDPEALSRAPPLTQTHSMQMILAVTGGREHLVPRGRVERLLQAIAMPDFTRTSLGGAIVERAGGSVRVYREFRDLPTMRVEPGQRAVWDGRLEITNHLEKTIRIGPLSHADLRDIEMLRSRPIAARPRAALLSCGAISAPSGANWLPLAETDNSIRKVRVRLTAAAIEHFCPASDFPLLEWLQRLDRARSERLPSR